MPPEAVFDWSALPPLPEPWYWEDDTLLRNGSRLRNGGVNRYTPPEQIIPSLELLKAWADEAGVVLEMYDGLSRVVSGIAGEHGESVSRSIRFGHRFVVYEPAWWVANMGNSASQPLLPVPTCVVDPAHENQPLSVVCDTCNTPFICPWCSMPRASSFDLHAGWYCFNCAMACGDEECERVIRDGAYCEEHGYWDTCSNCGDGEFQHVNEPAHTVVLDEDGNIRACPHCVEMYCPHCRRFTGGELIYNSELEQNICANCVRDLLRGGDAEEFDEQGDLPATRLMLPTFPGREAIRSCGVEIEGGGQGGLIARDLYRNRLSEWDTITGYHHNGGGFAHVERDSSVDWEMVVGPINMADTADVRKLNKAVRIVRKHIQEGNVKLDLRCGLHIHVGADKVALFQAFNLHHLYTYIEDPLFRLGAAKWPVHRAIVNTDHYCRLVPKFDKKVPWAQEVAGNRYYGLSFSNYITKMLEGCECGAVRYDAWDECTCALRKCTFEFRLFNTTANTKKLHAYLALTQALVAKALALPELRNGVEEFPALPFTRTRVKDMNDQERAALFPLWEERLRWIARELPLNQYEKQSLRYCVEHSELNLLGDATIDELFPAPDQLLIEVEEQQEEVIV